MYLERALTLNCSKELNEISKKKKWLPEYVITKIYSWKRKEFHFKKLIIKPRGKKQFSIELEVSIFWSQTETQTQPFCLQILWFGASNLSLSLVISKRVITTCKVNVCIRNNACNITIVLRSIDKTRPRNDSHHFHHRHWSHKMFLSLWLYKHWRVRYLNLQTFGLTL